MFCPESQKTGCSSTGLMLPLPTLPSVALSQWWQLKSGRYISPNMGRHSCRVLAELRNWTQPCLILLTCRVWADAGPGDNSPYDGSFSSRNSGVSEFCRIFDKGVMTEVLAAGIGPRYFAQYGASFTRVSAESGNRTLPALFWVWANAGPGHFGYLELVCGD